MSALGVDYAGWGLWIKKKVCLLSFRWMPDGRRKIVNLELKTLEKAVGSLFVIIICNGKVVL